MQITILDGRDIPNPENNAMLQALYSRSHKNVKSNLEVVKEKGSDVFLDSYLIKYGHKSIADCGYTTIYIENVSLLAAKVIQDSQMYSGQESSTRYLNFTMQNIYYPNENELTKNIYNLLISFYQNNYEEVYNHFFEKCNDTKAAKTKTFDVLRGFLPLGIKTQLSWSTNLRQAYDHTLKLRTHILPEVREIGDEILRNLKIKYPHSFEYVETKEQLEYLHLINRLYNFDTDANFLTSNVRVDFDKIDWYKLKKDIAMMNSRPKGIEINKYFNKYGLFEITYKLDYGSFRDLQRHRHGFQNLPLVSGAFGFNNDYIDFLPLKLRLEAINVLIKVFNLINESELNEFEKQYLFPLITNIVTTYSCTFPQLIYILELRSQETVHFSLRKIIMQIITEVENKIPELNIFYDNKPFDYLSIKRGEQDIVCLSNGKI